MLQDDRGTKQFGMNDLVFLTLLPGETAVRPVKLQ